MAAAPHDAHAAYTAAHWSLARPQWTRKEQTLMDWLLGMPVCEFGRTTDLNFLCGVTRNCVDYGQLITGNVQAYCGYNRWNVAWNAAHDIGDIAFQSIGQNQERLRAFMQPTYELFEPEVKVISTAELFDAILLHPLNALNIHLRHFIYNETVEAFKIKRFYSVHDWLEEKMECSSTRHVLPHLHDEYSLDAN